MNNILLFVYGTLKSSMSRDINFLFEEHFKKPRYIGVAKTTNQYKMYRLCAGKDSFPGIVYSKSGSASTEIYGELYEIDSFMLSKLDLIEGVRTGLYSRGLISLSEIHMCNLPLNQKSIDLLESKKAITYILNQDNTGDLEECGAIWIT